MTDGRMNRHIIDSVIKSTGHDLHTREFLVEVLYLEAEHKGQWWWKDVYRKAIQKATAEKGANNEDE